MNKKGFTLIELLAVIALLTLLGIFTISTILEQNESNKNLVDDVSANIIKTAAQEYVSLNSDNYERKSGNVYCLDIDKILESLNIDDIDANTKDKLSSSNAKVKVTYSKSAFEYDIADNCRSNVDVLPNTPNLKSNMIPIKWDKNNNIVKADINKPGDWYDYTERRWANAIIVSNDYLAALKGLKPGELIIPFNQAVEDVIFVVWIPRFKYSVNANLIDITFEPGITTSGNVHPAFEGIDGFWVSKFEITRNNSIGSTYSYNAYTNSKNSLESLVAGERLVDYNFLKDSKVKMISNYEWAAIAFLANSNYGLGNNKMYATDLKTGIIKKYVVGYQEQDLKVIPLTNITSRSTDDVYYSADSVFASTTRNATGIYGLSGGAEEWVLDQESNVQSVYNTDAAALHNTSGRLDSYVSTYTISTGSNKCLARGGNLNDNGLFAYEFYSCDKNLSTRITIK